MSFHLSNSIEHTLLKPGTTMAEVDKLCLEASMENFYAVCIPAKYIVNAKKMLDGSNVKVVTVISFPMGNLSPDLKVHEIEEAMAKGADELDMVIDLSSLKSGNYRQLEYEIETCLKPVYSEGKVLKIIVESGILTKNELLECCKLYSNYDIDFMKTSSGFASRGATVDAIRTMRANLPYRVGIKASGGIRTHQAALDMIDAGAVRLGTSASIQIMRESRSKS